jgi:hypothetical protein
MFGNQPRIDVVSTAGSGANDNPDRFAAVEIAHRLFGGGVLRSFRLSGCFTQQEYGKNHGAEASA